MTQRERRLALILGVFLAGGAILLFWQLILRPLGEYDMTIAGLERDVTSVRQQVSDVLDDKKKVELWQLMSLPATPGRPGDVTLARDEYFKYLRKLLGDSRFADVTMTPMESRVATSQQGKKPVYIPVDINIRARASLSSLVQMLDEFQRTPLVQKIKTLKIDRPEGTSAARKKREDVVTVEMTIEALVVTGAERRPTNLLGIDHRLLAVDALTILEHGPGAVALVPGVLSPTGPLGKRLMAMREEASSRKAKTGKKGNDVAPDDDYEEAMHRNYADIAKKNIFQGPPTAERDPPAVATGEEIDVTKYTYLTDITFSDWGGEAYIYFRASHKKMRLRISPGYRSFGIKDDFDDQFAVKGEVVKLESRDLYFKVGNALYQMHVGQNFAEALRQRVSDAQAKTLGLAVSSKKAAEDSDD